jgi:O-antigen/teichoic acid export membrane protein
MFVYAMQESLIAVPYAVYTHRLPHGERERYAGSALLQCLLLAAAAGAVFAGAGWLFFHDIGPLNMAPVAFTLAAVVPLVLLEEFCRRFAFAHLNVLGALVTDLAAVSIQSLAMLGLAWGHSLSAETAFWAMGLGCGIAGLSWLAWARRRFDVRPRRLLLDLRKNWSLGSWVFASEIVIAAEISAVPWLLRALADTTATGLFAACASLLSLIRPFWLGISNLLTPRFAHVFGSGQGEEGRRILRQTAGLMSVAMGAFCLVLVLFGSRILGLLYGSQYPGQATTITLLALTLLPLPMSLVSNHALRALERPASNLKVNICSLTLAVVFTVALAGRFGAVGAAGGALAGAVGTAAIRLVQFRQLTRHHGQKGSAA